MERRPTTKDWENKTRESIKRMITKNLKRIKASLSGDLITQGAAGRKFADKMEARLAKHCEKLGIEPIHFPVRLKKDIAKDCLALFREIKMDSAEVNAHKILLAKTIPDLRQIEINKRSEVNHVVHMPVRAGSADEWAKSVAKLEAERQNGIDSIVIPIEHVGAVD